MAPIDHAAQGMVIPNGWSPLDKNDRSSTVAYFISGAECVESVGYASQGDEVGIWKGVKDEETGRFEIETHCSGSTPTEDDKYVVATDLADTQRTDAERFAETREEAFDKASQEVMRLITGRQHVSPHSPDSARVRQGWTPTPKHE